MKKKILVLFASSVLALPMLVQAIGMGTIKVYSHLNERLRAEIPVLSVNSKNKGRVTVGLGSNAEFAKRGVERSDLLNDLSFSVVERGNGRMYIEVSSKKQIVEPYLNFILTLNDGEGMVSREFAVFLDPSKSPFSSKTIPADKNIAQKAPSTKKIVAPKPVKRAATPPASKWQVESQKGATYGPVRKKETLWSIATHTRPSDTIPVRDMVTLIMRANPSIFPGYQASKMPSGVTLNIPKVKGFSAYAGGYAPMPGGVQVAEKKTTSSSVKSDANKVADKPTEPKQAVRPANTEATSATSTTEVAETNVVDSTVKTAETDNNVTDVVSDVITDTANQSAEVATEIAEQVKTGTDTVVDNVKEGAEQLADASKEVANQVSETTTEATEAVVDATTGIVDEVKESLTLDIPSAEVEQTTTTPTAQQQTEQANVIAANAQQAAAATAEAEAAKKQAEEEAKKAAERRAALLAQPAQKPAPSFIEENLPYLIGGGGIAALLLALLGYKAYQRKNTNNGDEQDIILLDEDDLDDAENDIDLLDEEDEISTPKAMSKKELTDDLEADLSDLENLDDDFDFGFDDNAEADELDKLLGSVDGSTDSEDDVLDMELDKLLGSKSDMDFASDSSSQAIAKQMEKKEEVADDNELSLDFSLDDEPEISIVSPAKREDITNSEDDKMEFDLADSATDKVEKAKEAIVEKVDNFSQEIASRQLSEEQISRIQMKLDLANSFASISENKRAKDLINEVINEGSMEQVEAARNLLSQIDS